jgi:hypothetical protein
MKNNQEILEQAMAAMATDQYIGFCLSCGTEHDGIEPDARRYHCDACDNDSVYGAEEIVIMYGGLIFGL